jgi:hypothetical protein
MQYVIVDIDQILDIDPASAFEYRGIQYPANWLEFASDEQKASIPLTLVQEYGDIPDGYILTDSTLQIVGNEVHRIPTFVPIPLDQYKAEKKIAAQNAFATRFEYGFSPTGTLAGQVLQVRTLEDKTNWLTSQASYSVAIAQGYGAYPGATFRTTSNQNFTLTFNEGLGVLMAMAAWGQQMYGRLWAIKDAIELASTKAELDLIDVTIGWPS